MKKILLIALATYVLYCLSGVGLVALGYAERFYFVPYYSIKKKKPDKSDFSADGPWIVYTGQGGVLRQIEQGANGLRLRQDTLPTLAGQQVRCFVAETGRSFAVPLRGAAQPEPTMYAEPEQMLVVSDIEGNFTGFEALLRGGGAVDKNLNWSFGKGHLVLLGDFFDRGLQVTECLWLIYKLEAEAAQAGGKVHFILGNHERMNLTGDDHYLRRKYRVNADTLQWSYEQWYGQQTVLGQWLRSKNVVEKIGASLLMHAGLSPQVAALNMSLPQLNAEARTYLQRAATDTVLTPTQRLLHRSKFSLDWYRGIALEELPAAALKDMLRQYDVRRLIIGHTPSEKIRALYAGQVLAIDVPHQKRTDAQEPLQALLLKQGQPMIIDSQGQRTTEIGD